MYVCIYIYIYTHHAFCKLSHQVLSEGRVRPGHIILAMTNVIISSIISIVISTVSLLCYYLNETCINIYIYTYIYV